MIGVVINDTVYGNYYGKYQINHDDIAWICEPNYCSQDNNFEIRLFGNYKDYKIKNYSYLNIYEGKAKKITENFEYSKQEVIHIKTNIPLGKNRKAKKIFSEIVTSEKFNKANFQQKVQIIKNLFKEE
jgi:hypothetical protein